MQPLVVHLPIRFTDSINKAAKEQGVFKHARGILLGWDLDEKERERLDALSEPEVVLFRRPSIEMPNGVVYTLFVQAKIWSLDQQGARKIKRYGFPIVPDFGGTAHAYCGTLRWYSNSVRYCTPYPSPYPNCRSYLFPFCRKNCTYEMWR